MAQPSLDEIFTGLERAKTWARDLALTYPAHQGAVDTFIKDLQQLGFELNDGPYDETPFACAMHYDMGGPPCDPPSVDLFSIIGHTKHLAEDLAEAHPAYMFPLLQFRKDLHHAFKGLAIHLWPS